MHLVYKELFLNLCRTEMHAIRFVYIFKDLLGRESDGLVVGNRLLIRRLLVWFPGVQNDVVPLGKALHPTCLWECTCTYWKSLWIRVSAKWLNVNVESPYLRVSDDYLNLCFKDFSSHLSCDLILIKSINNYLWDYDIWGGNTVCTF